jgi:acyl carrier protein
MLTLDEFRALIAEVAEIDVDRVSPGATLVGDLGLDSLHLLSLMAALAEQGVESPEDLVVNARSVEGIYAEYRAVLEPAKEVPKWNLGQGQ